MTTRTVDWIDGDGLVRRSLIPLGTDDSQAALGVPVGEDIFEGFEKIGMPFETAKRLQNELRRRGFWTYKDVQRARAAEEIFAALQSAYRIDVAAVITLLKEVNPDD